MTISARPPALPAGPGPEPLSPGFLQAARGVSERASSAEKSRRPRRMGPGSLPSGGPDANTASPTSSAYFRRRFVARNGPPLLAWAQNLQSIDLDFTHAWAGGGPDRGAELDGDLLITLRENFRSALQGAL